MVRIPANRNAMIAAAHQRNATLDRIGWFQKQVSHLRKTEPNATNDHAASSGFLAEIDRMRREAREVLSFHPTELVGVA